MNGPEVMPKAKMMKDRLANIFKNNNLNSFS